MSRDKGARPDGGDRPGRMNLGASVASDADRFSADDTGDGRVILRCQTCVDYHQAAMAVESAHGAGGLYPAVQELLPDATPPLVEKWLAGPGDDWAEWVASRRLGVW